MAPADADGTGVLASPIRRRIVDILANHPVDIHDDLAALSAAELADRLSLHVTTLRFHLDQLVSAGLLTSKFERTEGVGRPRKLYSLQPGSLEDVTTSDGYRALAGLLTASWPRADGSAAVTPEQAGAEWAISRGSEQTAGAVPPPARTPGQWLGKIGQMLDLLREWGYTPNVRTERDGRRVDVTLVNCPFIELARTHTEVVCGIHRGLIRGAMETLGEPQIDVSLVPFVTPTVCRARIATKLPFDPPRSSVPIEPPMPPTPSPTEEVS